MGEAKDPNGDDHIEELLSQLQGIFGKLSHSEEEESQSKMDPPKGLSRTPSTETITPEAPPPMAAPAPPPVPEPVPETPIPAPELVPIEEVSLPPVVETTASPAEPAPLPLEMDKSAVFSLIFYPPNRDNEAKTLTEKVETMTPRFTKVAFQIKVAACIPIDPKGDPQETILTHVREGVRAIFVIVDRPMEEPRRKAMIAALEPRGIYVQEVPTVSIEKRAFYTDLLLGMVFFYDSLKSNSD